LSPNQASFFRHTRTRISRDSQKNSTEHEVRKILSFRTTSCVNTHGKAHHFLTYGHTVSAALSHESLKYIWCWSRIISTFVSDFKVLHGD
jgi:hypothetical protein